MSTPSASSFATFRLLCVCTGNVYRSRIMAEEFRRQIKARMGGDAGERFTVSTAGTAAVDGQPLTLDQAAALRSVGFTDDFGTAHALEVVDVLAADLILGSAAEHRSAALRLAPAALHRTFSLGELARLAATTPYRVRLAQLAPGLDFAHRGKQAVAAASTHRALAPGGLRDDIRDPMGQSDAVLKDVASQIRTAVGQSVDALFGPDSDLAR